MQSLLRRAVGGVLATALAVASAITPAAEPKERDSGCLECHKGIEPIRAFDSEMMQEIFAIGQSKGDPAGCVVCHGGDPKATEKEPAHTGKFFYADPSSSWINKKTCGKCHSDHTRTQWHSLMMTEAGKIQGTAWAFGSMTGYEHKWGNYDVENPKDPKERIGTDDYRKYMEFLKKIEPQVFVDKHEKLPDAPKNLEALLAQPQDAAFTYLRNQCLRCHHAVKGRQKRGDYRGMGCSSCHIPYSNAGLYEGGDKSIPKDEPGHMLVHSIQATREAKVNIHGTEYSGIPAETCATCHNRGKRIGVSFQGLMEIPYKSPFTKDGKNQPALHTKHYLAMQQDVHYQKGMVCQDCHTSVDVHSDGFLAAANLGAVEIECSDCHGTPEKYPWELPLGYMDEYKEKPAEGPPRGVAEKPLSRVKQGTVYDPKDGYLRTARGNPYANAVRDGNKVIVHTAAGKDIELKPLKLLEEEQKFSLEGMVAMKRVQPHMQKMECYTCHSGWAPQCYGCHVKIDYSDGKQCFDWLAAGHRHGSSECPECADDRGESTYDTNIPGSVEEQRSFTRWEDPPLGVNGEGRVTTVAPGCQASITIIGKDGKPIKTNHIFRSLPGSEGAGPEGQLCIDMSPIHPHTVTKDARNCESCHLSAKALGHGIGAGKMTRPPDREVVVDLETVDGHILADSAEVQMAAIDGLTGDWSRFVDEDGNQLQTVGHHFTGSRPLNNTERDMIDRDGVCVSCHQEIPDGSLAVSFLHHVAEYTGQIPETREEHSSLLHKIILLAGWGQLGAAVGIPLVGLVGVAWLWRRRRRAKAKAAETDAGDSDTKDAPE